MKSWILPFALVLVLSASGAFAQAMYKSTMPDGKVIYGEKPEPGAKQVEKVTAPPPKSGITVVTPADKAKVDQQVRQRAATEDAQRREVEAATKQLQQAEAALEAGKEPLPGERLGIVGGGTRLTDEYWARQKRLEQAVEAARKRLDQAQQAAAR
jgi:type IV secretory pathway VirB10-like protein